MGFNSAFKGLMYTLLSFYSCISKTAFHTVGYFLECKIITAKKMKHNRQLTTWKKERKCTIIQKFAYRSKLARKLTIRGNKIKLVSVIEVKQISHSNKIYQHISGISDLHRRYSKDWNVQQLQISMNTYIKVIHDVIYLCTNPKNINSNISLH